MPPDASALNYEIAQADGTTAFDLQSVMFYPVIGENMCVPLKGLDRNQFCDFGEKNSPGCTVATKAHCDVEATKLLRLTYAENLSHGDIAALTQMYPNKSPVVETEANPTVTFRRPVNPVDETEANPTHTSRRGRRVRRKRRGSSKKN